MHQAGREGLGWTLGGVAAAKEEYFAEKPAVRVAGAFWLKHNSPRPSCVALAPLISQIQPEQPEAVSTVKGRPKIDVRDLY